MKRIAVVSNVVPSCLLAAAITPQPCRVSAYREPALFEIPDEAQLRRNQHGELLLCLPDQWRYGYSVDEARLKCLARLLDAPASAGEPDNA